MPSSERPPATPLYWAAAGLLAGQLVALPAPALVALAVAVALLCAGLRARRRRCWPWGVALAALAFGQWQVAAGAGAAAAPHTASAAAGGRLWLRGVVVERPLRLPGRTRLVVAAAAGRRGAEWQPLSGRVQLAIDHAHEPWQRGDGIEALVTLRRPRNFGNPGEFDYEAYLARRGILATGYARSDRGWGRTPAPAGGLRVALDAWRTATARVIDATLAPPAAAIAAALLIGELAALDDPVRERYARAGVSHVLSISGLHIGLVGLATYTVARWLLASSVRLALTGLVPRLAVAASLGAVLLYGAIAGENVATLRAELMAALVAGALLVNRPREWQAPIAAAAAVIVARQPGAAGDISFQLSFAAVLALVLGVPRCAARWQAFEDARLARLRAPWRWAALRWLVLSLAVTCCAQLGTAPLSAWHFSQFSLVAPLANLVVVPLLGLVTVGLGLLATVCVAVAPALAPPLFVPVGWAIGIADVLVAALAALPGAAVRVPTPTALEVVLLYAVIGGGLLPHRLLRRAVLALGLTGLALATAGWWIERHAAGTLRVTMLAVGQGDSTLIEFPGAHVMLIDGGGRPGGRFDVGARVVAPALWRRKILSLDTLVLTHGDVDHLGGLPFVADAFAPRAFWWNGRDSGGAAAAALWRALARGGVAVERPQPGATRTIDGVTVTVLHPAAGGSGSDNDRSLTLQLRYGAQALLLPGDLEARGETALVARWGARLASTVLKVPHHGSRTSSTPVLLDAVRPRVAIASAGADNRFGFPAPAVEAAYAARGIPLWRTDRDGAVTIVFTGVGDIALIGGRGRHERLAP